MKYLLLSLVLLGCATDNPMCPRVTCTETQACTVKCGPGQVSCPMTCEPKTVCTVDPNEVPSSQ